MSWIAAGSAAASIVGGAMGGHSARKAAEQQRRAAMQAIQAGEQSLNRQRDIYNPFFGAGMSGLSTLQNRMPELTRSFTNADFIKDPGYEFRLGEGQKALEGSQAAKGGLLSGNAVKEGMQYNQGFASNEFDKAYNRFTNNQNNEYAKLMGLTGIGQFGAQGLGNAETNFSNLTTQALTGAGNAQAAGTVGAGNAMMQGLSGAGNAMMGRMFMGGNLGNVSMTPGWGQKAPSGTFGSWCNPFGSFYGDN